MDQVLSQTDTGATRPAAPRSRVRSVLRSRWTALALLLVAALVAFGLSRRSSAPPGATRAEVAATVNAALEKAKEEEAAAPARSAQVYQAIVPSLVLISTESAVAPGGDDPVVGQTSNGIGTGVVINQDGSVLTANHVVAGADTIRLTFADGSSSAGTIVSQQPENDIAVIMPEQPPEVIVPAVMGAPGQVGDETYAVGHPLGLIGSLSAGVISGLDRSIPVDEETTMEGLIQFDAAVNPGNSGGPLLNRNGQVIGIVTGLVNPSKQGFFVGLGFAVPIGTAAGGGGEGGAVPQ